MAKNTDQEIRACVLELLEEKSLDKISVTEICEKCEINRNTFYYHYEDIYDVLTGIIEEEEAQLCESAGKKTLLEEYNERAAFITAHKKAAIHLYQSKHSDLIVRYIGSLAEDFIYRYVAKEVGDNPISEEDMRFICGFYECALEGLIIRWLVSDLPAYEEDVHKRFYDSFYATIGPMIENCRKALR